MTPEKFKRALRSFLTTAIATLAVLLVAAEGLSGLGVMLPTEAVAWLTFFAALARTLLAALDPGMPLFGAGSGENGAGDEG